MSVPNEAREIMLKVLVSCVHGYLPECLATASEDELEFTDDTLRKLEGHGWTLAPSSDRRESEETMVKALIVALYGEAPDDLRNPDYSDAVSLGWDILADLASSGWTLARTRAAAG